METINTVAHGLVTLLWGLKMHLTGAQCSPNHKMGCVTFNSSEFIKEIKFIMYEFWQARSNMNYYRQSSELFYFGAPLKEFTSYRMHPASHLRFLYIHELFNVIVL